MATAFATAMHKPIASTAAVAPSRSGTAAPAASARRGLPFAMPAISRAPEAAIQRLPTARQAACLLLAPPWLKPWCLMLDDEPAPIGNGGSSGGGGASDSWSPRPMPHALPNDPEKPPPIPVSPEKPAPADPPTPPFFHGSTYAVAQIIPGNVKPVGGGDFGQGFYTHHAADEKVAEDRARWEGCRLCQKLSPKVRYAGVVRFDVATKAYRSLFGSRKTFGLTTTTQKDYAQRQKEWLDFVSGPKRGREANPVFDAAHMAWRHQRIDPPPDLDYFLIEGPMYKGVAGLPGSNVPKRDQFDPYAEGTVLPQQVVWNHQGAMDVLNGATTSLKQYDSQKDCALVDPPVTVPPAKTQVIGWTAEEEARIAVTTH